MLSLGNVYTLAQAMYTRDTQRGTGSRARGEGRQRGNLQVITPKPPVAQRVGGIYIYIYIYNELADEAASQGRITRTDPSCASLLKDDSQAKH